MSTINYGDPEPARDTLWRSHLEYEEPSLYIAPALHYDHNRGGWTVFGRQPAPQWHEIPESSFPLVQEV